MKRYQIHLLFVVLFFIELKVPAQTGQLMIGDKAPELKIEQWLKKGGFKLFEKGKVYLVDMWATWCVPCIAGMPHMSDLQKKYAAKGFEVIGITSDDKYGNSFENAREFVSKKDSLMNYNVAWVPASAKDSQQGIWLHSWMQQAGFGNLPTSFLIDRNGEIVYMGDPATIDKTVEEVIDGHYTISQLKEQFISGIEAENILRKFNQALKANQVDTAVSYGRRLLSKFSYVRPNTYLITGWQVAHYQGTVDEPLLQIGFDAVARGMKQTNFTSPAFFDVIAALYAIKKDYLSAIIAEKAAISLSDGEMKKNNEKNLEKYLLLIN